jgi:hypothetical protein
VFRHFAYTRADAIAIRQRQRDDRSQLGLRPSGRQPSGMIQARLCDGARLIRSTRAEVSNCFQYSSAETVTNVERSLTGHLLKYI